MLRSGGFWFPDGEHHFTTYGDDVVNYQKADREAAYRYVKHWRRALDVGANVGIFACDFAKNFDEVVGFEPMPLTRQCLRANSPQNVRVEPYAVTDQGGRVTMYRTGSSGGSFICNHPDVPTPDSHMKSNRTVEVEARSIDSYDFDAVDLIKLDVQGAEYLALLGARRTILRHRPVILVEEKSATAKQQENIRRTAELLRVLGMTRKERAQADRVYAFEID